jgi:hypothetical protein
VKIKLPLSLAFICASLFFVSGLAQTANKLTTSDVRFGQALFDPLCTRIDFLPDPASVFESIVNERFNRAEPCFNCANSGVHVGHLGENPVEFLIDRQIRGVGVFVGHLSPD